MPIQTESDLTARELRTKRRFDNQIKSSQILKGFFEKGFRSYDALKAIVLFYYPGADMDKLFELWHLRSFDDSIVSTIENVYEKLKSE